ncbi:hypothetical protein B8W66_21595 [Mycobacterium decipiens]|uniref:Uncharacterized protein n=1 Tax=Mycobacterium decipiens TaxID=1430326 RepID=A0A1X2LPI1_9MYCO|nr:hypothetical protein B8W66_21595 [Mycobacterium decipiens]
MNCPGSSGDSTSWEGWSHVRWFVEKVPTEAARRRCACGFARPRSMPAHGPGSRPKSPLS